MIERGARLGVDVGTVRVGVAVSDPDGLVATPVTTEARDGGDVERIAQTVRERGVVVVYIGLPRHLSGREGSSSALARTYGVSLARAVHPVPVRFVDERMSTVTAQRSMRASGRPGRRQREVVDQAAAVVILQAALDHERATGRRGGEGHVIDDESTTRQDDGGGVGQREVTG